jgi:hypothetical protein
MDQLLALVADAFAAPPGAAPARLWLESHPWVIPSPLASRWLLLADLAVIATLALRRRRPFLTLPASLLTAFLVLNGLGMLLTDFFLGLLAFHLLTGLGVLTVAGRLRWMGAGLLVLTILLALAT